MFLCPRGYTVPVQFRSSAGTKLFLFFLAGTKLHLMAGTKLYQITLSIVNAWLIHNTFVSDRKSDLVQCKGSLSSRFDSCQRMTDTVEVMWPMQ